MLKINSRAKHYREEVGWQTGQAELRVSAAIGEPHGTRKAGKQPCAGAIGFTPQ
jgi:hypothetical protein